MLYEYTQNFIFISDQVEVGWVKGCTDELGRGGSSNRK